MSANGAQTLPHEGAAAPAEAAAVEREQQRARILAVLGGQSVEPPAGRLSELAGRFGLDALEIDTLAVLWVSAFEPELRARLASREPFAGQITARLVCALFGHAPRVRLPSESPLLLWAMVQEHALIDGSAALAIDPAIIAWLEGEHELDRVLIGRARLLPFCDALGAWPIAATAERVRAAWQQEQPVRVQVRADDLLAARWFAAAVGRQLGLAVLGVTEGALRDCEQGGLRLQRQAWLDGCAPCLTQADAALALTRGVKPYPIQFVCAMTAATVPSAAPESDVRAAPPPAGVVASGAAAYQVADEWLGVAGPASIIAIDLPAPTSDERALLWRTFWPQAAAWPAGMLAELARGHEAGVVDIAVAAASAPPDAAAATQVLRALGRADLGQLARRIDAGFTWEDLVLPAEPLQRLNEIAFEARERARLWAEPAAARLFPYGRGLVALFAGPPGTGKTMAAQVIAAELGLDLLAVDLSAVVSKWVGETAQHLQTLLSSRAAQRAVLFFDEADALYAKRVEEVRDAQDRYANFDTSHLMTALENYPGIVLLASNLKGNIDSAFLRRIRHIVDFPKPDAAARERIWLQAVTALFGAAEAARLREDLLRVARIEATGAQIKNAALSAAFAARQQQSAADAEFFGRQLARELGKEGAGLSERELAAVLGGGV